MLNITDLSTKPVMLLTHLSDIENEKLQIIHDFFCNETDEKREFELYINEYISEIRKYIDQFENHPEEKAHPFVMIGSIIEVEDLEDGEVNKLQIVSPFFENDDHSLDYASYLSPVGKGLLLKRINEVASIETPAGRFDYKVKLIENPIACTSMI